MVRRACSASKKASKVGAAGARYSFVAASSSKNAPKVGVAGPRFAAATFSPFGAGVLYFVARTTSQAAAFLIAIEIHCPKYAVSERVVQEPSVIQNGNLSPCLAVSQVS